MIYFWLLPIVFTFLIEKADSNQKVCPFVNPICKCPLRELCQSDKNCMNGQKCCLDCCGGHRCTDPVEECHTDKCHKPHEEYRECGSACPLTCKNPKPVPCTLQCVAGCFCKNEYFRNKDGECVKLDQC